MNIKLTSAMDPTDGYGYIGESLALALDKLGHNVWVNPIKIWYRKENLKERTIQLMKPNKPDFELIIMYPTYEFQGINKNAAIVTMYEANKCPTEWAKKLNQLRLPIFAPSEFVRSMFKDSGVTVPISVLNLGIDTEFYSKKKRSYPEDRPFRFLTIGKMEPRKNISTLVKCFQNSFTLNENVELIIKTRERFLSSEVRRAAQFDKRIKVIEKTISEEELKKLYYYCDAFVYPSLGEGFGFPPRNAVATGLPTVVTGWSALNEIPGASRVPVARLRPMPACGFSYGQESELLMADIDEDKFMYEMYCLATDAEYYNKIAKEVYRTEQETWEECGRAFVEMISK